MQRIKKGDEVMVLAGRDKGKTGKVLRVLPASTGTGKRKGGKGGKSGKGSERGARALVDNVCLVKRHTRGNPNSGETGGIIEKEAPIHLSNLAPVNPASGKGERVGFKTLNDGRKVRYFKSNGEVFDLA